MNKIYSLISLEISNEITMDQKKELEQFLIRNPEYVPVVALLKRKWPDRPDPEQVKRLLDSHRNRLKDKGIL